jgi:hypothetical protein
VQPIKVSVAGAQVGSNFTPATSTFEQFETVTFNVPSAGNREVKFEATTSTGDNSSFIDDIQIVSAGNVPSPWVAQDINVAANQAGTSTYDSGTGTWTINGGGDDIWGTSDKFRYVYQDASGDCEIEARVTSVENTDNWAKAGVMIRESTAADARFVMVAQLPNNGVSIQWRTATGGSAAYDGGPVGRTASVKYVRLKRVGNTFTGYYKANAGDPWIQINTGLPGGTVDVTMATATKIGLAVTAHTGTTATDANRINTSTFTSIVATPVAVVRRASARDLGRRSCGSTCRLSFTIAGGRGRARFFRGSRTIPRSSVGSYS